MRTPQDTATALRDRLTALSAGHDRRIAADEQWLYLFDPRMPALAHGWKLHVSARAEEFADTLDLLVPVLLRHICDAKFAAGTAVLHELNAGIASPAAVGKAVTVYPRPCDAAALGRELAAVLAGRPGPRVLSDRQVRPGSPVHYRYGPFRTPGTTDPSLPMTGPGGDTFPGRAGTRYSQPPWAADPFGLPAPGALPPPAPVGGRFRLTGGIARSPHGDVYRAVDLTAGTPVVVKQARAHAGEDAAGTDARGRLRHEHAVLDALSGLDGVPRVVDHVRHGDDEYLVTTDLGPTDLRRDVLAHGPYRDGGPGPERRVAPLARRLLGLIDAAHARGVVLCDLKPGNVVLAPDGRCGLVDFGTSALHGRRPAGATPGYHAPDHRAGGPPGPAGDLYALGATLHYALTGLDPVLADPDPAVNRDRTLACLAAVLPGPRHRPVCLLVAGLMSLDPAERTATAARLRSGRTPPADTRLPHPPRVTAGLLDQVIAHTVATTVRDAAAHPLPPGPTDSSPLALYEGAAGIGLELLRHTDRPGVADAVAALARRTAGHPALPGLRPALYLGRTGVELFLRAARTLPGAPPPPGVPVPDPAPGTGTDLIGGLAGAGAGHLLLAGQARAAGRHDEAAGHLTAATALARALVEAGPGPADPYRPPSHSQAAFAHGAAHGRAGSVAFLGAHHGLTGDPGSGAAARHLLAELVAAAPQVLTASAAPGASRRYASWCRGLAGIGTVLLEAARHDDDPRLLDLGLRCARACGDIAPRLGLVSQCCGLSGVGELQIDAALATGDEGFWRAAERTAGLVLTRSGGSRDRPLLPDNTLRSHGIGWATGATGVLSFLRRLRDRGGPRPFALPDTW